MAGAGDPRQTTTCPSMVPESTDRVHSTGGLGCPAWPPQRHAVVMPKLWWRTWASPGVRTSPSRRSSPAATCPPWWRRTGSWRCPPATRGCCCRSGALGSPRARSWPTRPCAARETGSGAGCWPPWWRSVSRTACRARGWEGPLVPRAWWTCCARGGTRGSARSRSPSVRCAPNHKPTFVAVDADDVRLREDRDESGSRRARRSGSEWPEVDERRHDPRASLPRAGGRPAVARVPPGGRVAAAGGEPSLPCGRAGP